MIELLPEESKNKAGHWLIRNLLSGGLIILVWGSSLYVHQQTGNWRQKSRRAAAEIKKLTQQKRQLLTKIKQGQRYRQVTARANLAIYARIVKDLAVVIPRKVWLTEFQIQPKKVVFRGKAAANNRVITVLQRIIKYPYFNQIELAGQKQINRGISFRLVGSLNYD